MTYISNDDASVKYSKAKGEKNIQSDAAWFALKRLHASNHFQDAICLFSFQYPLRYSPSAV